MNVLKILKKENTRQAYQLMSDDYILIRDAIMKKMTIFKVNSYDALIIQRDLIGMAQEMKIRGTTLKEELGDSVDAFTEEIIQNSRGPSVKDILLSLVKQLSLSFFILFAVYALIFRRSLQWPVSVTVPTLLVVLFLMNWVMNKVVRPAFILDKGIKKIAPEGVVLALLLLLFAQPWIDIRSGLTVPAGPALVISLGVYGACYVAHRQHMIRLSEDDRNLIQDLLSGKSSNSSQSP